MLAASTKLVRSWTRKLWSYCNAFLCISLYFSPLHFFASLSPLHFVSLLVDGGPAVRLADKGGVRVIWRARRDFFLLSFEIIYCRMLYIVSRLSLVVCNIFLHHANCLMWELWTTSKTITGWLLCSSRSRPSDCCWRWSANSSSIDQVEHHLLSGWPCPVQAPIMGCSTTVYSWVVLLPLGCPIFTLFLNWA